MKAQRGLFIGLAILTGGAAAAGGMAAYYWQRTTAVPTWYDSSNADINLAASVSAGSGVLQNKLSTGDDIQYLDDSQIEMALNETDLNQLIQEKLSQSPEAAPLLEATEGLRANIEDNRLQAGAVVNLADLPIQDLPADSQQTLQQALALLPMLQNQAVYIGIDGNPKIENGQLVLGDDTRLQAGNVQFSLAEVARITGLSPAQLTEKINTALSQSGLTLDSLEVVNDQVILQGTPE